MKHLDLSINVDHVATIRNARGGTFPDPTEAARACIEAGADGITVHLREDRRHIRDRDVERIRAEIAAPLNFEMAATEEMVAIALRTAPPYCCLVPEKRAELTTEGGLDVIRAGEDFARKVRALRDAGIRVSVFVEADPAQIAACARIGAAAVELHTGTYADAAPSARAPLLARLKEGARVAVAEGLLCHAGHGLTYENLPPIAAMPEVTEVSIGHFLVGQAIFDSLPGAVRKMRALIATARSA